MTNVTIKRDVYLFLFGIVLSLTAIYALMVNQSYQIGLNESAKYGFLYELKLAESEYLNLGSLPQSQSATFQIYLSLDQIPSQFLTVFEWRLFDDDVIYEHYLPGMSESAGKYLYAATHYIASADTTFYVISEYDEAIYLDTLALNPPDSVNQFNSVFVLIGVLLILVFVAIRILVYRITKPIFVLSKWSETLDLEQTDKLKQIRYREVSNLANKLIESVRCERDAIEREEFFLRAASHELRTPLSIMRASGEMLERISDSMPKGGQRAVGRIKRSVLTMQTLVTTLLWMSRNVQDGQESNTIHANEMLNDVVDSHRYLLENKQIKIDVNIVDEFIRSQAPRALLEIVLANIVRNAFQHSIHGTVSIRFSNDHVEITNPFDDKEIDTSLSDETSYGIGLILIEKVCQSQRWQFSYQKINDLFITRVSFHSNSASL